MSEVMYALCRRPAGLRVSSRQHSSVPTRATCTGFSARSRSQVAPASLQRKSVQRRECHQACSFSPWHLVLMLDGSMIKPWFVAEGLAGIGGG
eukprot:365940-Chlamydomonas_euryale.AAC.24